MFNRQGNLTALVDDEDFELVNAYKWRSDKKLYAVTGHRDWAVPFSKMEYLILGWPILGYVIDHVNGNGLDNRRSNLRLCTQSQNLFNRVMPSHNTSGFKGVHWDHTRQTWMARAYVNGKQKNLGRFDCKITAAIVYNQAALANYGEFAKPNLIPIEAYEK